jgi:hypothetical protein
MCLERASGGMSLLDVLDRVLDKGIVIDAWWCISLVEIDRITVVECVILADQDAAAAPGTSLLFGKFGSASSSHSALRIDDDDGSAARDQDSQDNALGPRWPGGQERPAEGAKDLLH